jgi:hypothetical protein
MLDIARTIVLLVAFVHAVRYRLTLGAIFTGLSLFCMAIFACMAYSALARHNVDGEYGFAFVYIGPTMLPFGGREWLPTIVQFTFVTLSAIPAIVALQSPSSERTGPFLVVFVPNAMLAVLTALSAFLMWRQETVFREYWENPSLVGRAESRKYVRLALRPGRDESALASVASQTPVALLVRNHSSETIHLVWIDFDGRRSSRPDSLGHWEPSSAGPGIAIEESSWAKHAFVVTDGVGHAMCTFVLGSEDSVADVDGPCR